VLARVVDERSYAEIAAQLKTSQSVVRQRVLRGLATLDPARRPTGCRRRRASAAGAWARAVVVYGGSPAQRARLLAGQRPRL
jgi:DNA-directed RNA polymerase specialized sigma24 family protein